jgi:hypothetical protein
MIGKSAQGAVAYKGGTDIDMSLLYVQLCPDLLSNLISHQVMYHHRLKSLVSKISSSVGVKISDPLSHHQVTVAEGLQLYRYLQCPLAFVMLARGPGMLTSSRGSVWTSLHSREPLASHAPFTILQKLRHMLSENSSLFATPSKFKPLPPLHT